MKLKQCIETIFIKIKLNCKRIGKISNINNIKMVHNAIIVKKNTNKH